MKRILALSGSTRVQSSNWQLLRAVTDLYKDQVDIELYPGLDALPHFNPNLKPEEAPTIVQDFLQKIQGADGVLICTPEYVFSPPAVLKNALEWTVSETVFSFKPVAMIVASGAGEKTFESLALILKTLVQEELPETSKLLIQGARGKMTSEGVFSDIETQEQVMSVMDSLIQHIGD